MTKVIGVRFRTAGKIYFFAPGKFDIKQGDNVIVETARGVEFGRVVSGPKDVKDEEVVQPLKSVIRPANEQDRKTVEKNSAGKHLAVYIKGKGLHKAQPQGELAHKKEQLLGQKYGSGPLAIAEKQSQHQRGAQPVGDEYGGQIDQGSIPLSAPGAQPAEGGGPVRLLTGKS